MAYKKWLVDESGSCKLTLTKFSMLMSSRLNKSREHLHGGYDRKKAMVFIVGAPPEGVSLSSWLTAECQRFEDRIKGDFT
ncbi:hypothetical protein HQN60_00020 [Deefgea piscis]|uniref:Uncharacterized protein n=1 Tax=Deefgea piscis TaxID=2739061 RepID=A0A6M8SNW5_9NEIS|nr:hypothetical protein [Deefgea piscis]QKJ65250.1 hypothetical protein HQN60_00020 [Deefgea piscis]